MTPDNYALPAFHFLVEWNGNSCLFAEARGLGHAERNAGDKIVLLSIEQELQASTIILLEHGVLTAGTEFEQWLQQSRLDAVDGQQHELQISLVNEMGEALLQWHLKNVVPLSFIEDEHLACNEGIAFREVRLSYGTINYLPVR